MRRRAARWISVICVAALLCGCRNRTETAETGQIIETEAAEAPAEKNQTEPDVSETEPVLSELPEDMETEQEEAEEPVVYQAEDVSEAPQYWISGSDKIPPDTVEYVESSREEIMEIRQVESVVDEKDPGTYRIVQTEREITVTEEIPVEYTDVAGRVKYACENEVWHEYKYSTGDVTMDDQDEEIALFLLNLDGFYDGYEPVEIVCTEVADESMQTEYAYHVTYRRTLELDGPPEDVSGLTVSRSLPKTSVKTEIVEEKVPVMISEEVGTGEYRYYGWQKLDDEIYYFDRNGEKVTGEQVIRGVRHVFDRHGVRISSAGVNISEGNGPIDWKAVEDEGIEYAMIRGAYRGYTEGKLILDSRFAENVVGARRAGIDVGLVFYSQAVSEKEAVEEASLAVELVKEHQISRPIVIAVGYANASYTGRADSLSVADRSAYVEAFCRTVQNAGYTPMIYAEKSFLENCLDAALFGKYLLYLAQYNTNVTYAGPYEIWQYTARGSIDGISGNIGLNISYAK